MPGPIHQGLLFLIRTNPRLVFELAERFDANFRDGRHGYEDAANELPDPADPEIVLYADYVVAAVADPAVVRKREYRCRRRRRGKRACAAGMAVEVQTCDDELKFYAWLSYAAGVRREFGCRGWTIVFAPDTAVRRRAQKMFEDEARASPWFVEPEMLPPITEVDRAAEDVDKAVLTAVFHARSPIGVACIRAAAEAIHRVAHPHARVYLDLMQASLTDEQLQQLPDELFDIDPEAPLGPMELTGAYYTRGLTKGREEGLTKGRLLEARSFVQRVLERRGLSLDELQRQRIESCEQLDQLERWLDRAWEIADPVELFDGPAAQEPSSSKPAAR